MRLTQRDKETSIFYRYCVISFVSEVHLVNFWTTKKYFKIEDCRAIFLCCCNSYFYSVSFFLNRICQHFSCTAKHISINISCDIDVTMPQMVADDFEIYAHIQKYRSITLSIILTCFLQKSKFRTPFPTKFSKNMDNTGKLCYNKR